MSGKNLHEVVGLAQLLVKSGLFTIDQVVMAMNISYTLYVNGGYPEQTQEKDEVKP